MTDEERRAWIRMLLVLLVAVGARAAWDARAGGPPTPGRERDAKAALDTVDALTAEAARRSRPLGSGERLDPNRADPIALDRLPGVGPATATAIVQTRTEAPFGAPEDMLRVPGIGPSTLEKLRPYLRLDASGGRPSAPLDMVRDGPARGQSRQGAIEGIDINRADSVDLQRLPGIGPALAGRIVRSRQQNGAFRSVDDLVRVTGIGPATVNRLRSFARTR